MRCESKRSCARRETQPGSPPGQASQRGAWPFWPQPEGNGAKTAPLVVTLLAQAASLGVVARLDWRCFSHVRTRKSSVNRPYAPCFAAAKAAESGKPADIVAKMVEGSVTKYLKEVSLHNQAFVKNDKQTVEQMLKAANTSIKGFTLYVVGEGIEKKVDNFADEVAAQVAAARGQ